ncbi:helix-turn-helix domain-containing protein, partial [uncultured Megasphaera sp.]|uniref:helix-turn-helix domain-containing protein n=1 Tax=uncultured Megasphaera sp. TaxID=165188 RepID=UPI00265966EC
MCHYNHLILSKREKLLFFLAKGYSCTQIAAELGRNKSTISRELHRNASGNQYLPVEAQAKALQRHLHCRPRKKLDNPALLEKVKERITMHQWSPEEISHR